MDNEGKMINKAKTYITAIFLSFFYLIVCRHKKWNLIIEDIDAWSHPQCFSTNRYMRWCYLMASTPAFRNVFYFRIKGLSRLISWLYVRQNEPYICVDNDAVDGGLFFCHGFSTIVVAKSIGKNCWINQQVTIGATGLNDYPTIGNNVHILVGSLVLGDIHIGDNAVIGAGAVVTKSVPENCVVVGNPARIIRRNGIKVDEKL